MEGRESMSSVVGDAAAAARGESSGQVGVPPAVTPVPLPSPSLSPFSVTLAGSGTQMKKRRGRPRKYGQDGNVSLALVPMPLSASAPPGISVGPGDFSNFKRGRGRPTGSVNKHRVDFSASGEWPGGSNGGNFTPHVITIAAGEDVTTKIISFSQQGPWAICILSANGAISNVTLRQPDSSGGTLTYEGRFEILSLSGSFMPTESGGTRSRSGGMSVSLASADGRVVGGGVAGVLVAASPVQVVIGSFMPNVQDQKPRKHRLEPHQGAPTAAVPISRADMDGTYVGQGQRMSTTPKPSLSTSSSFRGDNWGSLHSLPDTRNSSSTDINISLPGG